MKAYGLDLRERVVKFIAHGGAKAEAARWFGIGRRTVHRYLTAARSGVLAPKTSWGHWRKLDPQRLQAHAKKHPDAPARNSRPSLASAIMRSGFGWASWASL